MGLIDKAKLMNHIESESGKWGEEYDSYQILGDIEDFDTVEAIPIDWLIEYVRKITGDVRDILIIIDDWRKENNDI